MKKRQQKKSYTVFWILLVVVVVVFYLRQQIYLIKFQNRIKQLYDDIRILENKNKQLVIKIQQLKDQERLKEFAKKLNLVAVNEKDIIQ